MKTKNTGSKSTETVAVKTRSPFVSGFRHSDEKWTVKSKIYILHDKWMNRMPVVTISDGVDDRSKISSRKVNTDKLSRKDREKKK